MLANTNNILQMCSFDTTKSTKGASKLRRDLINAEIANLRDLLPLPSSTRQRLSQLQLMALVCVYVRKANYFQHVFRKRELPSEQPIPHFGFSKALSGFLMMMTQNGKLLYISDNAAEYLGHSMEDLLIHGDSVYDIIEKQDHQAIQAELMRTPLGGGPIGAHHHHHHIHHHHHHDTRIFLCRMNVSRNARRQMRFGDQKVVLVEGHFVSYLPLCSRNEPVFLATCTPVAMPETRECVVQGSTTVFTSIHSMDMKFLHVDLIGECHLGYSKSSLQGVSWYELIHWDHLPEAQSKHRLITQSEQERSCILLLRLQEGRTGRWLWVHVVLQIKDGSDSSQQSVIVCTNQILSEKEAAVMRANSWLYQYYSLHSKMHYGLAAYDTHPAAAAAAARLPTYYSTMMPYPSPTEASVPHSPYHLHPSAQHSSPINGSHHHHHQQPAPPPPMLPYGGGVPYASLPPDHDPTSTSSSTSLPTNRWNSSQSQKRQRSPSPERRPPSLGGRSPYHTPGTNGSVVGDMVVPPAAYYGTTQVLAAVSYSHLVSLRGQQKGVDEESLEQSLTPTNTEDVSAMISLSRPSSYLPLASVLSESARVLSDPDELGRREDCRTLGLAMSRERLDMPYVRYTPGRFPTEHYPVVGLDPVRRYSRTPPQPTPKPDIRQSFWNSSEYTHLGPPPGDCFPENNGKPTYFDPAVTCTPYQDLTASQDVGTRLRLMCSPSDHTREEDYKRISNSNNSNPSVGSSAGGSQNIIYNNSNATDNSSSIDKLVRRHQQQNKRQATPSPPSHSRASSDC